jgi:cellulose 1,4-beta-cellobiosidase
LTNCYDVNECSSSICPYTKIYSNNCVINGVDYSGTYCITSSVNSLKLVFVTNGSCSTNIGSRIYLLKDETHYQIFGLKNKKFIFTVYDSNLSCELNDELCFVSINEDGWTARFSINKAKAKHETEYFDTQCQHTLNSSMWSKCLKLETKNEWWKFK